MNSALIPFVVTDPRVPIVPHQAPPQPSQAELEVVLPCPHFKHI